MMAAEATVTVEILDQGRPGSPARWIERQLGSLTALAFFNRVMYSPEVDERWHWVARQHEAVLSRPPDAAGAPRVVNWEAPLSDHVDPGTNTARFILEPPPSATHAAVGAGVQSAGGPKGM
jgi:hypothetical protein